MAMSWGEIASLVSAALAVGLVVERVVGRLIRGQYVTRDELRASERSVNDALLLEGRMRADVETKVKLLEVNMLHLPSADDVAELKDKLSALSASQAVNNVQVEHVRKEVAETRLSIDRLSEEIRKRT
ncbi:MAG: hypothetical protein KIS73_27965 [Enhydrobacter sp.]|nr:hypothetical protein [Enhydrobacter sp.]